MIVMFVDLAGFTALTEAHGDETSGELLERFCKIVRGIAERRGLREVKTIGDAFLLTADDASAALEAALDMVTEIGTLHNYPDVRIGIHAGDVIEKDGDIFGKTVNLAARVASEASAGQILVTAEVLEAAPRGDAIGMGTHRLRNIPRPVDLYAIGERTESRQRDPVCRMMLNTTAIVGTYEHDGETYHFCSKDCLVAFAADPAAYTLGG